MTSQTFDILKENNRETIGEIQLQTIDNLFENWTDHINYRMANRDSHLNEIISHY